MADKLWYDGKKTKTIIFTEEDLSVALNALAICEKSIEDRYHAVATRIMFQMM